MILLTFIVFKLCLRTFLTFLLFQKVVNHENRAYAVLFRSVLNRSRFFLMPSLVRIFSMQPPAWAKPAPRSWRPSARTLPKTKNSKTCSCRWPRPSPTPPPPWSSRLRTSPPPATTSRPRTGSSAPPPSAPSPPRSLSLVPK